MFGLAFGLALISAASAAVKGTGDIRPLCNSDNTPSQYFIDCSTFAPVNDSSILFGWSEYKQ
jgi:hypothetical protein